MPATKAVEFADHSMEAISYFAILASSRLAAERGTYSSYQGSKWDRGLLPIDTIDLLEQERGCRSKWIVQLDDGLGGGSRAGRRNTECGTAT